MKAGPDIARVASLLGDPARANMLMALMSGRAHTASELAQEAGVTAQTASAHLAKLNEGGLVTPRKQGRHRYFALAGADVASVIEGLTGLAARAGHMRTRTGPSDPALRCARACYDHLAGDMGVAMYDSLLRRRLIVEEGDALAVTPKGRGFFADLDIDLVALAAGRRALAKPCLDWSARRTHLAGALGAALLDLLYAKGWAVREKDGRAVHFTRCGEAHFLRLFPPAQATRP
jgi:DNA-binding transcriptional ArsR family regulator